MVSAGTPIIYALLGDLIGQRTGITSLSVEGSMPVSYTHLCRQPQPKVKFPAFPIAKKVHIGFSCVHHLLFVKLEFI